MVDIDVVCHYYCIIEYTYASLFKRAERNVRFTLFFKRSLAEILITWHYVSDFSKFWIDAKDIYVPTSDSCVMVIVFWFYKNITRLSTAHIYGHSQKCLNKKKTVTNTNACDIKYYLIEILRIDRFHVTSYWNGI